MILLYKHTKPNLRGRRKLKGKFKSMKVLLNWVDKNIPHQFHINYSVNHSDKEMRDWLSS